MEQRALLAQGLAKRLEKEDAPLSDRRAAETLARELAGDAIEVVRRELSKAVRQNRFLPRDIAMKIARDVDSVACPFLEVTEVFGEADWQTLILNASMPGRVAISRRVHMSEPMVNTLAEVGDASVAEALLENHHAPIKRHGFTILIQRFPDSPSVLERMVARKWLPADVAVALVSKVSEAAREQLAQRYGIVDFTDLTASEARGDALLKVIQNAPAEEMIGYAESLNRTGELGPSFLLKALRMDMLAFVEQALALRAELPVQSTRLLFRSGSRDAITRLCEKAGIPKALWSDFCSVTGNRRQPAENSKLAAG